MRKFQTRNSKSETNPKSKIQKLRWGEEGSRGSWQENLMRLPAMPPRVIVLVRNGCCGYFRARKQSENRLRPVFLEKMRSFREYPIDNCM